MKKKEAIQEPIQDESEEDEGVFTGIIKSVEYIKEEQRLDFKIYPSGCVEISCSDAHFSIENFWIDKEHFEKIVEELEWYIKEFDSEHS